MLKDKKKSTNRNPTATNYGKLSSRGLGQAIHCFNCTVPSLQHHLLLDIEECTKTHRACRKKGEGGGTTEKKYVMKSLALKIYSEFLPQYNPNNP